MKLIIKIKLKIFTDENITLILISSSSGSLSGLAIRGGGFVLLFRFRHKRKIFRRKSIPLIIIDDIFHRTFLRYYSFLDFNVFCLTFQLWMIFACGAIGGKISGFFYLPNTIIKFHLCPSKLLDLQYWYLHHNLITFTFKIWISQKKKIYYKMSSIWNINRPCKIRQFHYQRTCSYDCKIVLYEFSVQIHFRSNPYIL